MTFSAVTLSMTTLRTVNLIVAFALNDSQHNNDTVRIEYRYAECRIFFTIIVLRVVVPQFETFF